MPKDRNIFDEDGEERSVRNLWRSIDRNDNAPEERGGKVMWTISVLVVAAAVFSAVVWYSYPGGKSVRDSLSAPVIRADSSAYRIAPDEPGGMEIADSQSTVFDAMRGPPGARAPDSAPPVENLLAAGEESDPVPRDRLFAGLNTERVGDGQDQKAPSDAGSQKPQQSEELLTMGSPLAPKRVPAAAVEQKREEAPPASSPSASPASPDSSVVAGVSGSGSKETGHADDDKKAEVLAKTEPAAGAAAPVTKIVKKADAEKEAAPAKAAKLKTASAASALKKPAPGSYYVQVASVPTRGHASKEWAVLQAKYTDLKPLSMRVQQASLSKGTFYRVQAGPMAKADADRICAAIKARKPGGCLVVRQ